MRNYLVGLILCCTVLLPTGANELHTMAVNLCGTWQYVDFDCSMKLDQFVDKIETTERYLGINGWEFYDFCKDLYEKNSLSCRAPQKEPRIPKVIHFIWLGSPLPDVLKPYVNSWIEKHPEGWKFQLWTDESVKKLQLINQDLFDAVKNPGMKSDILRYELIYRFGGLYVDTDFECLQPVDILHHTYDFYSGVMPLDTGLVQVTNGLLAACPGHPIFKDAIETLKVSTKTGMDIPQKTGPIHLSKSIYKLAGKTGYIDVLFPASYFFPLGCLETVAYRSKWKVWGSFGVHWWAKSWSDKKYRPTKFDCIDNYHLLG